MSTLTMKKTLKQVYRTIAKEIKKARKNWEHTATVYFYQEHDVMKVIEELAKCGWRASAKRCYNCSYPDLTIIEYKINL